MDFIKKYLHSQHGNAVPERYKRWCAISLLSMVAGRRYFIRHPGFDILTNIHICLVGDSAIKKTTPMNFARDLLLEAYPDYPVGAAITSREEIVTTMAREDSSRYFYDYTGVEQNWRPLACFVNELTNFMSFNPQSMIEFITDMYGRNVFDSGTLARKREVVKNPYLSILACTTPKGIIGYMKGSLVGGGFMRRMLFIYETQHPPRVTFPTSPLDAIETREWCRNHLIRLGSKAWKFGWAPGSRELLEKWHKSIEIPDESILAGYYASKEIIAQQIAMCIALSYEEPHTDITPDDLDIAIAFLESNEDNLPRLTIAAGRNELALPQAILIDYLEKQGGMLTETSFHKAASMDFTETEYYYTKRMLKDTGQLYFVNILQANGVYVECVMTPAKYKDFLEKQKKPPETP